MKSIILPLILFVSIATFSQTDSTSTKENRIWKALKYDTNTIVKNIGNSFTQPLRWKGDDLITAGGIIAGTSLLYFADNDAQRYFLKQEKNIPNSIQDFGWYFGSPQNFFIVSAGIYGFGLITDNEKVRRTGVLIVSASISSGFVQSLSKTIIGRSRPKNGSHDEFSHFSSKAGFHSFPSGHAVLSFTMAHAIAKQFDSFWTKAGIYTIGSIAPISRLWANAHWVSDVGLGMVLAIVFVDGVDNFMNKKNHYDISKKTITWNIRASLNTIGLVGTF